MNYLYIPSYVACCLQHKMKFIPTKKQNGFKAQWQVLMQGQQVMFQAEGSEVPPQAPAGSAPGTELNLGGITEMGSLQNLQVAQSFTECLQTLHQAGAGVEPARPALQPHGMWPVCSSFLQRQPAQRLTLTSERCFNSTQKLAFLKTTCIYRGPFVWSYWGLIQK